jgi:hypothetical protein
MIDQEKCIKQFVLSVEKNVKSHSSLTKADLYTAENVTVIKDPPEEDIKLAGKFFLNKEFS